MSKVKLSVSEPMVTSRQNKQLVQMQLMELSKSKEQQRLVLRSHCDSWQHIDYLWQ